MRDFFSELWAAAGLFIAAGLLLLLLVQTVRLEGFNMWPIKTEGWIAKAERFEAEAKSCEARHAVTRASVDRLEAEMASLMEAAREREAAFTKAKEQAEADRQRLEREKRTSDARIARLRELAARPSDGRCEVDGELLRELEGL